MSKAEQVDAALVALVSDATSLEVKVDRAIEDQREIRSMLAHKMNAIADSLETACDIQLPPTSPACQFNLQIHMDAVSTAAVTKLRAQADILGHYQVLVKSSESGSMADLNTRIQSLEISLERLRTVASILDQDLCPHRPEDTFAQDLCSLQSGCHGQQVFIEMGNATIFINKVKFQMLEAVKSVREERIAATKTFIMLNEEQVELLRRGSELVTQLQQMHRTSPEV